MLWVQNSVAVVFLGCVVEINEGVFDSCQLVVGIGSFDL